MNLYEELRLQGILRGNVGKELENQDEFMESVLSSIAENLNTFFGSRQVVRANIRSQLKEIEQKAGLKRNKFSAALLTTSFIGAWPEQAAEGARQAIATEDPVAEKFGAIVIDFANGFNIAIGTVLTACEEELGLGSVMAKHLVTGVPIELLLRSEYRQKGYKGELRANLEADPSGLMIMQQEIMHLNSPDFQRSPTGKVSVQSVAVAGAEAAKAMQEKYYPFALKALQ